MGGLRGAGGPGADHRHGPVRAAREYRPVLYPRRNPLRRSADAAAAGGGRHCVGGMVMPGGVGRDPDFAEGELQPLRPRVGDGGL